ncbi:MAG: hypothetical protein G01um101418_709 [Parcubacteria group bacterium Gr01-1014_18]|nr:MAG: hypothetical protein Greene041636_699 [Parcubacteria group bacterium Greene0416_36]TSC80201.1 MAG: hypothetical protein G01um101418_709 [Parcubacteria group bacterium Gr01-1014_18]TSC98383.1 MAG: hypothetical protein Greene101420_736 [Parcubacteria group bacterium Greene1014_20]
MKNKKVKITNKKFQIIEEGERMIKQVLVGVEDRLESDYKKARNLGIIDEKGNLTKEIPSYMFEDFDSNL